jgi:hypothetical protein
MGVTRVSTAVPMSPDTTVLQTHPGIWDSLRTRFGARVMAVGSVGLVAGHTHKWDP